MMRSSRTVFLVLSAPIGAVTRHTRMRRLFREQIAWHALPVLAFHGDQDTNVPIEQSYRLRDAVRRHGGEFTVEVMQGEGHGIRNRDNQLKEYEMTEAFLRRFLEMHA